MNKTPYDATNSSNPWLMEKKTHTPLIGPEGLPLTAQYIWSKNGADREALVEWVFNHYRTTGYPFFKLTDSELKAEFERLKNKNSSDVIENGIIKNSNCSGLDIAKHFTSELFFNARGGTKTKSCIDVFNNDDLFKKVLRNRMGWNITKESGTERPYVFAIDDEMISQGMRSSGLGFSVSHFKPLIAKYIYEKYNAKKVLDYSSGWGARAIAAISLGVEYYGIDPLTSAKVNELIKYFGGTGFAVDECSEVADYSIFPDVDLAFSSPPYFDLETYADDNKQSSHYKQYSDWLEKYWKATVKKCCQKSKYFSFIAVEKVKKYDLLSDMKGICEEVGCEQVESIPIKTSTNHLSNKKTTGRIDKKTEHIMVYRVKQ